MPIDIRLVAAAYIAAGRAVVPLVKGEKRASSSWQNTTYTPKHFKDGDGIAWKCGEPSGGLVDVDLDCPEAIAAAKLLMPSTGLVHGRPSKPESHLWYVCPNILTSQFKDVKDAGGSSSMIVEIRSTGGYTAVPPSGHPSGEELAFSVERDPAVVVESVLYECTCDVAITALVLRHWNEFHHADMGHLAGFLLHGQVAPDRVRRVFDALGRLGPGQHHSEIIKFAESTIGRFDAGQVTGGPKLVDGIGVDLVAKMRGWLRMADLDALEEMNRKHFFVRLGSKAAIGREDSPTGIVFQSPRELYPEYANQKVQVGTDKDGAPIFKPIFPEWLESPLRRSYREVTFAPPPLVADDTDYNLWKDFALEEAAGDCSLILDHMRDNLCRGNLEHFEYLLKFCAWTVQYPAYPPGVAVVLRGEQGTGKGAFMHLFERIFGRHHYTHLDRSEELVKWNSLVSGKVVVFADEAFFAGDKENTGALKRIITEPTLRIARKHLDSIEERNCIHLFMATNEEWAVPAGIGERRFFALHVSAACRQDAAIFGPLWASINGDGTAAFLHHMRRIPVTADEIRNVPRTAELRHQQNQSLPLHLKWLQECLWDGQLSQVVWAAGWVPVAKVYDAYKIWVREHTNRFLDKLEFGRQVNHYLTAGPAKTKKINGNPERCIELRDLDEARKFFDSHLKTTTEWPTTSSGLSPLPF